MFFLRLAEDLVAKHEHLECGPMMAAWTGDLVAMKGAQRSRRSCAIACLKDVHEPARGAPPPEAHTRNSSQAVGVGDCPHLCLRLGTTVLLMGHAVEVERGPAA